MKKKALYKDFYMEIIKTRGRFLSILFIVALGVAFFSGIRSSEPDMIYSGDEYFDQTDLYDGKIVSTMGLTGGDLEAIKKVAGVAAAEGAYGVDTICDVKGSQKVLHVMSITTQMNTLSVLEGKLPTKTNECFIDKAFIKNTGYKLGDWITLESGTKDSLKDTLATDKYKIVGIGHSPSYISYTRGSSLIGTGEVSGFAYVTPESFTQEVYSEIYITVTGAKELIAFTKPYETLVEKTIDNIEKITTARVNLRREELVAEATDKLNTAEQELAEKEREATEKLTSGANDLQSAEQKLVDGQAALAKGKSAIAKARATLITKQKEVNSAQTQYNDGMNQLIAGTKELNNQISAYNTSALEATNQIQAGEAAITQGRKDLDVKWEEYNTLLQTTPPEQLVDMKMALDAGEAELTAQATKLSEAKEQLAQGAAAIEAGKNKIAATQKQLEEALVQINSGQQKINDGWTEITAKEKELVAAKEKLLEGETSLADGKAEYEKAKAEAAVKIADAKAQIEDARQKISTIERPKWYVKDRNVSEDYAGYGDNAARMKAIGKVFPILFFLVAALISLTTMTRMVEEQRTQIGTLKALGYRKRSIMSKYLNYALLATITGSILGVLIGEKILPYVIVRAYKIMYMSIPNIALPYNWSYAVMATVAAVACTTTATLYSCYKELTTQPAVLMRPPSPKKGKRIFMERIPFIWNRLNFTWKSTMRNLIRYKKRFFMTVLGIGGCMALIVVGFGIKDSVFGIATIQYDEVQLYDMTAFLKEDITAEKQATIETNLSQDKKIEDYTELYMKSITIGNGNEEKSVYLSVPQNISQIEDFISFRNRITGELYHLNDSGVILTEKMGKLLDAKAGDSIKVEVADGEMKDVKITAICENYMGHYIYMSPKLYKTLYGEAPTYNAIAIKTTDKSKETILKIGERTLDYDGVLNVSYMYKVRGQLNDMLGSLNIVILVLIVSAGMLAFVVLYNLNNININERRRELATIKVLGFYDAEVASYVYRENILLTLIGIGVGVILGRMLHQFTIVTVEIDNVMFGRNINAMSYVYSILFTVGFSLFVNGVMYYKLKKINMVESLKSVE